MAKDGDRTCMAAAPDKWIRPRTGDEAGSRRHRRNKITHTASTSACVIADAVTFPVRRYTHPYATPAIVANTA
jgi:hypothetical protein